MIKDKTVANTGSNTDFDEFHQPTLQGIEAFLAGPFIKGIGKVYAKKITDHFGKEILDPSFDFGLKLKEIAGLGDQKILEITESISQLKVPIHLFALLYSAGLSDADVEKITSHYGKRLKNILKIDPYDMVENVWRLSFFTADKLGKFLGIPEDDPRRLQGALLTSVKIYAEEGNMFATESQTLSTASKISGITTEKIKPGIDTLIEQQRLVKSLDGIYLPVYYKAEKEAGEKLLSMINKSEPSLPDISLPQKDILGNPLSEGQKNAISTVLNNKVTIITGGPGTGKTTTIRGIVSCLLNMDKKVTIVAPTGRAAKRISELTGQEAQTIHRLLGYSMGRGYKNKLLKTDILIIDEASMLEQVLFNHLLQALSNDTKVVLVGDTNQLPAIGAGNVLGDMIESGVIPVIQLHENFRQEAGCLIAGNAEAIKSGEIPQSLPSNDYVFVEGKTSQNIHDRVLSLIADEIPSYTGIRPQDIQLVTPQQEGPLGAKQLNIELQEKINPNSPELKRGMKRFRKGDRVMQTTNSSIRGIYNGEIGYVSEVEPEAGMLEVTFNDGKKSRYGLKDLKELSLAYATTVHKLQGSETDYMVMIVTMAHRPMLYRNLLYTGISRAKKLCVVAGESKALELAVATTEKNKRNSNFKKRLLPPVPETYQEKR